MSPLDLFVQLYFFAPELATNCLYWPLPLIQWSTTMLSSHVYAHSVGRLFRVLRTFTSKLVAICNAINSRRGIVSPCLAS